MRAPGFLALCVVLSTVLAVAVEAQVPAPAARGRGGPGRITGVVSDTAGQPLVNALIAVRSAADSAHVAVVVADRDGRFGIADLALGDYVVRVSLIGYKPRSSEHIRLTVEGPAVDLGPIALQVSAVQLQAVEAITERAPVVVEADRTVYHTKSMVIASTGEATDVLRAIPELEVDVNDNVKLRGNQPVAIHVNGRPAPLRGEQLANFLRQLPGNRIERVEVMPNPSAKHDAEGTGGIVNIVLQDKADLGLSGNVAANASTRNRQRVNGRFSLQRGRLTLFTGAGLNISQEISTNYDLRQNLVTRPITLVEQHSTAETRMRGWNGDWTAELKVGEQATLWTNAWLYARGNDARGLTEYGILTDARAVLERYERENDSEHTSGNYNLGLGFKQVLQPRKEELTIDGRWSAGLNDSGSRHARFFELRDGVPVELPVELTLNDIDAGDGTLSVQADYFRPLGAARLDVGYRAYRRAQDNDNQLRIFEDPDSATPRQQTSSGYDYAEMFHSWYATYGRTSGKFGVQAGVRLERSNTRFESLVGGASFERGYTTLFPSLNLSYRAAEGRTVRLLYAKRIRRPAAHYLDPYLPATDPLNRFFGNPDLKPSYTHSFSLDFGWYGQYGTLRVVPYYRRTTDSWERIRTVDTLGVATSRWANAASGEVYGSTLSISLSPTGPLSGSTTLSVYRDVRDGSNISTAYRSSALMWSVGGYVGVKLGSSFTAQAYANHYATQSILQGRASGYTFLSLSLRQQLWGEKGSLSLNINDPLNLFRYDSTSHDATYIQTSRSSYRSRVLTLGLAYNFGRTPERQSRRAESEESGEIIRVR